LKPDFEKKAPYLLSCFVKGDTLLDHILESLQKAGFVSPEFRDLISMYSEEAIP
jgi:hypothetical protein